MGPRYECRLTIIGRPKRVASFDRRSSWRERLGAKYLELYENSPGRLVWWFETSSDPTAELRNLAEGDVTLLLFYEEEQLQECGLARAVKRRMDLCHFQYGADRPSK